jgi:hypothetical protein
MCFRARYYSPGLGRFISEDPIGFSSDDFNLYRYAYNRPVSLVDPLGQASIVEYTVKIGNFFLRVALHPPHHYWTILGLRLWCIHIFIRIALGEAGGNVQIPLPWCYTARP